MFKMNWENGGMGLASLAASFGLGDLSGRGKYPDPVLCKVYF
jgi:hypothetical protein